MAWLEEDQVGKHNPSSQWEVNRCRKEQSWLSRGECRCGANEAGVCSWARRLCPTSNTPGHQNLNCRTLCLLPTLRGKVRFWEVQRLVRVLWHWMQSWDTVLLLPSHYTFCCRGPGWEWVVVYECWMNSLKPTYVGQYCVSMLKSFFFFFLIFSLGKYFGIWELKNLKIRKRQPDSITATSQVP